MLNMFNSQEILPQKRVITAGNNLLFQVTSPKFQWSIDELALLKPADIELPHPDAFFSGSVIAVLHTSHTLMHMA